MSTPLPVPVRDDVDYPTGDGQPVAETEVHRDNLLETVWVLQQWYKDRNDVYVSGNMFVYYVRGDRHRHLAPDVFVVHGVPKAVHECYKTWEEPKQTLDLVIEFTSRSTKEEDLDDKFGLYRDELGVREYLLFDPYSEYLAPPQQLFRLKAGEYEPVEPVDGRLPSEVLGLHFERDGMRLRLWVPESRSWLLFPHEIADEYEHVRDENERLRAELDSLKRRIAGEDSNAADEPSQ